MSIVLETNGLTKHYGNVIAVNDLNLQIHSGSVFGILGPNGSGKTTTLAMILGVILPTSGQFSWFQSGNSAEQRKRIGAILETPNFYPHLNAQKNLEIVANIRGTQKPNLQKIIDLVGLGHRATSPFKSYSLGMKQRLAIGATLIGNPEVLIFDEPTNGLDPEGIAEVRGILLQIAQEGKTILFASHMLEEVEKICTDAAIIKRGKLLASGSVSDMLNTNPLIEIACHDGQLLQTTLNTLDFVAEVKPQANGKFLVKCDGPADAMRLNKALTEKGVFASHLLVKNKSLEAEFLDIINAK